MPFPDPRHEPLSKGERVLFAVLVVVGGIGVVALAALSIRFLLGA